MVVNNVERFLTGWDGVSVKEISNIFGWEDEDGIFERSGRGTLGSEYPIPLAPQFRLPPLNFI